MANPLHIAISNFIEHCQAVPGALGSAGTTTDELAVNNHSFDIPYPHAITTGGSTNSESMLSQIRALVASRPQGQPTFVVDSASRLDLTSLGFKVFFDTPWFFSKPDSRTAAPGASENIQRIQTPSQLVEFDRAAAVGFGQTPNQQVYSASLLNDERYDFFVIRINGEIVSGVQTFTDEESTGIYTLFTHQQHQRKGLASALVQHALAQSSNLPAVTNPGDESHKLFSQAGFRDIGKRTLWRHD